MTITADEVRSIIASEAGIDIEKIMPDATLESLDIGSLDVVSILFELEDRFSIEIEPESIPPSWTISELIEHIVSHPAR